MVSMAGFGVVSKGFQSASPRSTFYLPVGGAGSYQKSRHTQKPLIIRRLGHLWGPNPCEPSRSAMFWPENFLPPVLAAKRRQSTTISINGICDVFGQILLPSWQHMAIEFQSGADPCCVPSVWTQPPGCSLHPARWSGENASACGRRLDRSVGLNRTDTWASYTLISRSVISRVSRKARQASP